MEKDLFRTVVNIPKSAEIIDVSHKVLFIGSCFATNMGSKMEEARFPAMVNPFGTMYNPMSIAWLLDSAIKLIDAGDLELAFNNGLWHSFFHHGMFSCPEPEDVVNEINRATTETSNFLKEAEYIVITFGTSYVYEHKEKMSIVANCHKFPDNIFNRYLVEPEEIIETYTDLIVKLRVFNPHIKIIFTVSPVRHLKDGAHGNQISKSVLLLAIEKLIARFEKTLYFPSYEIVMDELRDYRFYNPEMIQPNEVAIEYIWKRFMETYFSDDSKNFYLQMQKIIKARNHRPSGFVTEEHIRFINRNIDMIDSLKSQYPHAFLENERQFFLNLLP